MSRLQIMDTTIRDGQQSLWATRMSIGDMLPILPKMDRVGYWAIEAWGGATFDSCMRFLDENPWDRLRSINAATPNTPLSMLTRGQNLVGYKHYSREIVNRFIKASKRNGVHVFRVFDALNDIRNVVDTAEAERPANWYAVKAPMVGTFYAAPAPGEPAFVKVGDEVAANQTLCIVEAMKLMNEITAEEMGTVREVCVKDADPVEFGTVLFYIEPHSVQPVSEQ